MQENFLVCDGHDTIKACDDGGNKITAANENRHAKYILRNEAVVRDGIAAVVKVKRNVEREAWAAPADSFLDFCWPRPGMARLSLFDQAPVRDKGCCLIAFSLSHLTH